MLEKLLLQSEYSFIQEFHIRLVKYMMVLQQWTGWNRKKREVLLSQVLQQLVNGTDIR